ncbi:methylthioadenosine phosphorylase [Magnetococcus marinus MC-1]|uniref:Methylthioadenosine phosphorylase n=1 Tax=Magnetococcus marinus (strain ATCC BAA-1437 / JCM 17883 / MC-1) TaxID=156889 RepID=A0L8V4_MAGMM|nr:MTAP family purine nucleoside phosphorylase [Magnetococcus marinus]ABK44397.1 methylthioadenosine phosphorylase [Magnetococcus marinus MC-1]
MSAQRKIAVIGGTSLLESHLFSGAKEYPIATPFGKVTLLEKQGLVFLQRHGMDHYTPPHLINHKANLAGLKEYGITHLLAIGSVGSMKLEHPPGTFLIPDDFLGLDVCPTFFEDARGHQVPGFDPAWRQQILAAWPPSESFGAPVDGGVYWQTRGPRFETQAEIRMYQAFTDVVGMTVASECILARELDLAYAAICIVDNYANGISDEPLTYAAFKQKVAENEARLGSLLHILLERLSSHP